MTLVATYNEPEARVELVTTGLLTAGATIFSVQRAPTPSGPWTGVRGAVEQIATTNSAETWYDYEYDPGPDVTNYYQVVSKAPAEFVSVGTSSQPYTLGTPTYAPGLPAGRQVGDVMIMLVAQSLACASAPSWTFGVPGWTLVFSSVPVSGLAYKMFIREVDGTETTPSFDMPPIAGGGVVGAAQIALFRYVRPTVLARATRGVSDQPASTSQIGFPELGSLENFSMFVASGISADPWTSVAPPVGWTQIDDAVSTDRTQSACTTTMSLAWQYLVQGASATVPAGVMTVTGGSHAASSKVGYTFSLPYDPTNATTSTLFTDDVDTPLSVVWLKDPLRPPRNVVVQVASPTQIRLAARSGLFDIKGRADPVEISEIRRSASWTQRWVFTTFAELDALLELFAPGRTLLLHVPARGDIPDCPPWPRNLPGGFIYVGDVAQETAPDDPIPGTMTAPVQIVAAPDAGLDYLEDPIP